MTFNIFTTKRVSCFGQYDRIDDLITFQLVSVDEFHASAVFKCFDPLFVSHVRSWNLTAATYSVFGLAALGCLTQTWAANSLSRWASYFCFISSSDSRTSAPEGL